MKNWAKIADNIEDDLLKSVKKVYRQALKDVKKDIEAFQKLTDKMQELEKQLPEHYTQKQIEHWRQGFYARQDRFNIIYENINTALKGAGEQSASFIQDVMPDYFNLSRQETINGLQTKINVNFAQLDKNHIKAILTETQPPFSKIAYKNLGNNKKTRGMLRNELLQSVMQGEGQDKLAKRLKKVAGYKYAYQAKRLAQTERNRIANEGSFYTAKEAQSKGLIMTKEWSATMSNTRDTHANLNGKVIPIDEVFKLTDGDELMYPSDPNGKPENIINCRCGLIYDVVVDDKKLEKSQDTANKEIEKNEEIVYNKVSGVNDNSQNTPDYSRNEQVDKLNSTEEIVKYFEYEDKYGDDFSPIDFESWSKQPLEVQKEVAQGLDYAKKLFNLEYMPDKIQFKKLKSGAYGEIELRSQTLSINSSKVKDFKELCGTTVHEMAHYYDYMNKDVSEQIYNQALKNLGLRKNGKDTDKLQSWLAGATNKNKDKHYEVFAYSIESKVKGNGNKLSDEIFSILEELLNE